MDKEILLWSIVIGVIVTVAFLLPYSDSAIPPTRAWSGVNVSLAWNPTDWFMVESENANDNFILVSDGSIRFNVTDSYP